MGDDEADGALVGLSDGDELFDGLCVDNTGAEVVVVAVATLGRFDGDELFDGL